MFDGPKTLEGEVIKPEAEGDAEAPRRRRPLLQLAASFPTIILSAGVETVTTAGAATGRRRKKKKPRRPCDSLRRGGGVQQEAEEEEDEDDREGSQDRP